MELLLPDRFEDTRTGYVRTIFEGVASGTRPAAVSITPSTRHVGVTRRDTFRPGFPDAVEAAGRIGYPVLVRSSGGGATAADLGTFGFSIIRPTDEKESGRSIRDRYDEAANFVLGAFSRVGVTTEVGEVRDEFCPGGHSIRVGDRENGMKVVGMRRGSHAALRASGALCSSKVSTSWHAYSAGSTVALVALIVAPESGGYLVAFVLIGHAGWDAYHYLKDRVVARSYAEFCGIADLLLGGAILLSLA